MPQRYIYKYNARQIQSAPPGSLGRGAFLALIFDQKDTMQHLSPMHSMHSMHNNAQFSNFQPEIHKKQLQIAVQLLDSKEVAYLRDAKYSEIEQFSMEFTDILDKINEHIENSPRAPLIITLRGVGLNLMLSGKDIAVRLEGSHPENTHIVQLIENASFESLKNVIMQKKIEAEEELTSRFPVGFSLGMDLTATQNHTAFLPK